MKRPKDFLFLSTETYRYLILLSVEAVQFHQRFAIFLARSRLKTHSLSLLISTTSSSSRLQSKSVFTSACIETQNNCRFRYFISISLVLSTIIMDRGEQVPESTVNAENSASEQPAEQLVADASDASGENLPEAELDDDDVTVIMLDQTAESQGHGALEWIEQTGPEMEERRRNVLLRELRRVQRASFLHFALLCLIPTALLLIVVATVIGDEEECSSDATFCELEPRTFINAFTTRCVCDPIPVSRVSN
jgi:hypothetical protein